MDTGDAPPLFFSFTRDGEPRSKSHDVPDAVSALLRTPTERREPSDGQRPATFVFNSSRDVVSGRRMDEELRCSPVADRCGNGSSKKTQSPATLTLEYETPHSLSRSPIVGSTAQHLTLSSIHDLDGFLFPGRTLSRTELELQQRKQLAFDRRKAMECQYEESRQRRRTENSAAEHSFGAASSPARQLRTKPLNRAEELELSSRLATPKRRHTDPYDAGARCTRREGVLPFACERAERKHQIVQRSAAKHAEVENRYLSPRVKAEEWNVKQLRPSAPVRSVRHVKEQGWNNEIYRPLKGSNEKRKRVDAPDTTAKPTGKRIVSSSRPRNM